MAQAIRDKLSELSPNDKALFAQRYADFDQRLAAAEKRWDAAMAPYKGTKIVTYHRSWPNFMERFGLEVMGYVEPKPGIPPSPGHTIDLIGEMKRQGAKLIVVEPYFDLKTPQAIANQTRRQGAGAGAIGRRHERSRRLHQAVRLRHRPAVERAETTDRKVGAVDWSILQFLAPAIAASLIIAGIHAYLGLHVVERGVIFVDLSLAQIASLGAAIAVWQGYDPHTDPQIYWMSLGFTMIGALIFAMVKGHEARIPQEAIIGISYAVASAAVILTMSQATGEAEHLKDMLVGNILSVQWPEVWQTAAIYVVIGIFHFIFRKRFLEISVDHTAHLPGVFRCGSGIFSSTHRSASS